MASENIDKAYKRTIKTMNVIYIEGGVLSTIVAFPDTGEGVESATNLFIYKIESYLGEVIDAEERDHYIGNGVFNSDDGETDILLEWSL